MRKVFVVGNKQDGTWIKDVEFTDFNNADVVMFTGGEDVNPAFYGEKIGLRTECNIFRDEREKIVFDRSVEAGKFIVGICRGFQFIHAVQGYQVAQHVTMHNGPHKIVKPSMVAGNNIVEFPMFTAPGSHHQNPVYKPEYDMLPLAYAYPNGDVRCFNGYGDRINMHVVEAALYPRIRAMGVQYHPEWTTDKIVHEVSNLFLNTLFNVCPCV